MSETRKTYYWLFWLLFRPETHQGVMPVLHQCDTDMLQVWYHWHCCRKGSDLEFSLKRGKGVSQKILLSARHCLYNKTFSLSLTQMIIKLASVQDKKDLLTFLAVAFSGNTPGCDANVTSMWRWHAAGEMPLTLLQKRFWLKIFFKKEERGGGSQKMLLLTRYCLYNKLFSLSLTQRIIKLVFDLYKRDLLNFSRSNCLGCDLPDSDASVTSMRCWCDAISIAS